MTKLDNLFKEEFKQWCSGELLDYLEVNFNQWLVNPLGEFRGNSTVEVFISVEEDEILEEDIEDRLHSELMLMGIEFLESRDYVLNGYTLEVLGDYMTERLYLCPLEELGDDPLSGGEGLRYNLNKMK